MILASILTKTAVIQISIGAFWLLMGVYLHNKLFEEGIEDQDTVKVLYFWIPWIMVGLAIVFVAL